MAGSELDASREGRAAQPLYDMLARIRKPVAMRDIVALCLRHVLMGDPFADSFADAPGAAAAPPDARYLQDVHVLQMEIAAVKCAVYKPTQVDELSSPVMFYMHGGGFVTGSSDDTDYTTRRLCLDCNMVVVSINYPLAPEVVFPGALDACLSVANEVYKNLSDELKVDATRIYLCGDSAGGNLAAAMAQKQAESGKPAEALILLAPWLDMQVEKYDSYNKLAPKGIVYDAAFIGYARGAYVRYEDWTNPLASPIHAPPDILPPTLVLVGTGDPVLDQCRAFADARQKARQNAKPPVELVEYAGMPHCFYAFPGLFAEEEDCYRRIAGFIKEASSK